MRSRLAWILLPIAVLLFLVRPRLPTEVPLHVHLGARGAEVRQIDLKFVAVKSESIARDLTLHFPNGAPAEIDRSVRIAPGDYQIAIRLLDKQGHEARETQPWHVEGDGAVEIDAARLR